MNHSEDKNGQSPQNTSGEEGRQEGQGQENMLQQQTRADAGGTQRKRDRIIVFENSTNIRQPFVLEEIGSVSELEEKLCARYPEICLNFIGLRISNSCNGNVKKKIFQDVIPYDYDTLYIWIYLKKHSM